MAMHRFAFNAGEFSPILWWRSDLQKFFHGSREIRNWFCSPQGAIFRRPGTEVLASLGEMYDTVRLLVFEVSETVYYPIVLVPDGAASKILIFDQNGRRLKELDAPWGEAALKKIQTKQIFDVTLMCHGSQPLMRMEYRGFGDDGIEPFQLIEHHLKGGPFLAGNQTRESIVSVTVPRWDVTVEYPAGETVMIGENYPGQGLTELYWYGQDVSRGARTNTTTTQFYYTKIPLVDPPLTIETGDKVTIEGTVGLDGDWTVGAVLDDAVCLNTGTTKTNADAVKNDYSGISMATATLYVKGQRQEFYTALSTTEGDDPQVSPDKWRQSSFLHCSVGLESNEGIFKDSDIGRLFRIETNVGNALSGNYDINSKGKESAGIPAYGVISLRTEGGKWAGELALQKTLDGGRSWDDIAVIESIGGTRNESLTRTITEFGAMVRVYMRERSDVGNSEDTGCIWYLEATGSQYAVISIDAVETPDRATGSMVNYVSGLITNWKWAFGVFGQENGFPTTLEIHEERLILSGVPGAPNVLYGSQIHDWENWQEGTEADSPFIMALPADGRSNVCWMVSRKGLLIGTTVDEWRMSARAADQAVSATNVKVDNQTNYGSAEIDSIPTADLVIYLERGSRRLRGCQYNWQHEGYLSKDMTILAPHVADSPIVEMAFGRSPEPNIYTVREDGKIFTLAYDQENDVTAWTQHGFSDNAKTLSVAIAPAQVGDDVLSLVKRDGGVYLERMRSDNSCIDFQRVHQDADGIYPQLNIESGLIAYDALFSSSAAIFSGNHFISVTDPTIDLIIHDDGKPLIEGRDYYVFNPGAADMLVWLLKEDIGPLTVYDFSTLLQEGTHWKQTSNETGLCIELLNDSELANLSFSSGGIDLVENQDYWLQDNRHIVLPWTDEAAAVDVYDGADLLVAGPDYRRSNMLLNFSPNRMENRSSVTVGKPMVSEWTSMDLMSSPEVGGPGGRNQVHSAAIYVVDSVGGEVSADGGTVWEPIKELTQTNALDTAPSPYTGRREVSTLGGWKDEAILKVRNSSPHQMKIACVGADIRRTK